MKTGFKDLDELIDLEKNSLVVIAARPAMGKTTFALNIATNIALKGNTPVAIFSLEMSKKECVNRIISLEATVKLSDTELYIDDTPGISVDEIREKCIKLKQEKNLGLVIIDYFQLVSAKNEASREQELSSISHSLKNLSKELNIPILITSQLSKTADIRYREGQDPRPIFEDLKYSGSLVQDADAIMFLYRDDYYYKDTSNNNTAEVIIAKNIRGNLGTIKLCFSNEKAKFTNLKGD